MLYGAISGMVRSLQDDYTVFFPPEDAKIFKEDVSGEFSGVGMEIGMRNSALTVIAPLDGTPAQKAGLKSQDIILEINDEELNKKKMKISFTLPKSCYATVAVDFIF